MGNRLLKKIIKVQIATISNSVGFLYQLKCKPIFLIPNIMSHCTLDQMEVTEAGNPDDATSKTTHLKSTTVICIYVVMNVKFICLKFMIKA